ncbi:hypothetical protein EYF80_015231 [Liparis tanakae]|uniref:Uncharacterized protein n=1 Tax=Liparis tanakae TaxID=230148 RepID=A0A4Z2I9M7_9TELE|nr:hypothetical protein EYF80_015231 [Liparis tanakae]
MDEFSEDLDHSCFGTFLKGTFDVCVEYDSPSKSRESKEGTCITLLSKMWPRTCPLLISLCSSISETYFQYSSLGLVLLVRLTTLASPVTRLVVALARLALSW